MSLTYLPFSNARSVEELRQELRKNVSDEERVVSGFLAGVLLAASLLRGNHISWIRLALGAFLVRRALTGRCPAYAVLSSNTRHPQIYSKKDDGTFEHPSSTQIRKAA